jgi:hypothetical protein
MVIYIHKNNTQQHWPLASLSTAACSTISVYIYLPKMVSANSLVDASSFQPRFAKPAANYALRPRNNHAACDELPRNKFKQKCPQ